MDLGQGCHHHRRIFLARASFLSTPRLRLIFNSTHKPSSRWSSGGTSFFLSMFSSSCTRRASRDRSESDHRRCWKTSSLKMIMKSLHYYFFLVFHINSFNGMQMRHWISMFNLHINCESTTSDFVDFVPCCLALVCTQTRAILNLDLEMRKENTNFALRRFA